jgi:ATP-dependent helicase/DNAse subunit B
MVASSSVVNTASAAVSRTTELILGPYRSGKTTLLLNQIMDYCQSNPLSESLIVVPSHRYKGLLEKRLRKIFLERSTKKAAKGFVGLKILTFQKLCEQVLRKEAAPFKLVPQNVRPILIGKCMERLKVEGVLNHVAGMVAFAGAQQSVLELIDEFERAALTPSDLIALLEKTAHADSRYMELAQIYAAYTQELAQAKLNDEKGLALRTREYLYSDTANLKFGFVAVDGFDRFNTLQLQVLSGLARYCQQLRISFDYLPAEEDTLQEYVWKETSFDELTKALAGVCRVKDMPVRAGCERAINKFRAIDRQFEFWLKIERPLTSLS